MRALVIKSEPLKRILSGKKTWEIRGSNVNIRGPIALIESGTGSVVGRCVLADVHGPLTIKTLRANARKVGYKASEIDRYYRRTFAWVLQGARKLAKPVPYKHPPGAITWVKLSPRVAGKLK